MDANARPSETAVGETHPSLVETARSGRFEHGWPAIFSIALGALFHSQQRLLMCNMEDCQKFLKREIWNEVVDIATAIKSAGKVAAVTAKQLDSNELEYLLRNS